MTTDNGQLSPIDAIAAAICAADEAGEDAHGTDAVSALALDALTEAGYVVLPLAEVKHDDRRGARHRAGSVVPVLS